MGDSKNNQQALYRASLPNLAPLGEVAGCTFSIEVVPRQDVHLLADGEPIDELPDGTFVHPLGEMLPVEMCEVLATLISVHGKSQVAVASMRFPLKQWREAHSPIIVSS